MADNTLPSSFPPMGAEFKKPYMEFEYEGKMYKVEELSGGHNGRVASACQASPPHWDEEKQRWVVDVTNNLIDIDLSNQPHTFTAFDEKTSAFQKLKIINNPRHSYKSTGQIISVTNSKDEPPTFPVDCVFNMHIRASIPGKPSLITVKPFQLYANKLETWPPPVGTVYNHDDDIELYPEWVPFSEKLMKPIVTIKSGDKTIITKVLDLQESIQLEFTLLGRIKNLFVTLINRLT